MVEHGFHKMEFKSRFGAIDKVNNQDIYNSTKEDLLSEYENFYTIPFERLIINTLMFDKELLPNKILRWLGSNHPDNKTRKVFFRLTIGKDTVINQNFIVSDNYEPLLEIGNRVTIICASSPNKRII